MKLNELDIHEKEFDLFVALDDKEKIEFLFDATQVGIEASCVKQVSKLAKKYIPKVPFITNEEYQVGPYRLSVTTLPNELYLNSNSLKAIRKFVSKLFNDGVLLFRMKDAKKTPFDIYRYFRAYQIIGKEGPISPN